MISPFQARARGRVHVKCVEQRGPISDCIHQSASDKHGRPVEHVTRRARDGCRAGKCVRIGPKQCDPSCRRRAACSNMSQSNPFRCVRYAGSTAYGPPYFLGLVLRYSMLVVTGPGRAPSTPGFRTLFRTRRADQPAGTQGTPRPPPEPAAATLLHNETRACGQRHLHDRAD